MKISKTIDLPKELLQVWSYESIDPISSQLSPDSPAPVHKSSLRPAADIDKTSHLTISLRQRNYFLQRSFLPSPSHQLEREVRVIVAISQTFPSY